MLNIITIPTTPFAQNTRILFDDSNNEAIACDVGGDAAFIYQALNKRNLKLKGILLTHGHLDHVGGVAEIAKLTGAPILGPDSEDDFLITTLDRQAQLFGLSSSGNFVPQYVKENEIIDLLPQYPFKVLHTPGHTPGEVCYYCEKAGVLLA